MERDYRGHRDTRDSRDPRDYRNSRDLRDTRDSRDYGDTRNPREYRNDSRNHREPESKASALVEGIEDSSQLTAVIERAKARRTQNDEEIASVETELITSPISSEGQVHGVDKKFYVKLKEEVSGVVIRFLSHYKTELAGDFKSIARKYTHKIIEKELKDPSFNPSTASPSGTILNTKKKLKIKNYLGEVLKARGIKLVPEHETSSKK